MENTIVDFVNACEPGMWVVMECMTLDGRDPFFQVYADHDLDRAMRGFGRASFGYSGGQYVEPRVALIITYEALLKIYGTEPPKKVERYTPSTERRFKNLSYMKYDPDVIGEDVPWVYDVADVSPDSEGKTQIKLDEISGYVWRPGDGKQEDFCDYALSERVFWKIRFQL